MEAWKEKLARLKGWLVEKGKRLKPWLLKTGKRLNAWRLKTWEQLKPWLVKTGEWLKVRLLKAGRQLNAWLSETGKRLNGWLLELARQLEKRLPERVTRQAKRLPEQATQLAKRLLANGKRLGKLSWERSEPLWRWVVARRERVIPAAAFLAVSLTVFTAGNLLTPRPAARMARRYLDAAFAYDYMELYSLFDQPVLEGELARYGLDRAGMAAVAQTNSAQLERYVAQLERDYGVELSYSYQPTGERPLQPEELERLQRLYAADGYGVELLAARRVPVRVSVRVKGQDRREVMARELELTVLATPRGWSLDRDSTHAFLTVIYDLPDFVQKNFGA